MIVIVLKTFLVNCFLSVFYYVICIYILNDIYTYLQIYTVNRCAPVPVPDPVAVAVTVAVAVAVPQRRAAIA